MSAEPEHIPAEVKVSNTVEVLGGAGVSGKFPQVKLGFVRQNSA